MARDQVELDLPKGEWTQLTNADVTAISFQVLKGEAFIRITTDATAPTAKAGALFRSVDGVLNVPLSDIVQLAGATRVWAKPAGLTTEDALVWVDHA